MNITNENFTAIYEKCKNSVFSVAFNYVLNAEDANDIVQETFIRLFKSGSEFTDINHIKAWLLRVCINLSKNHIRDVKAHENIELFENIPYFDKHEDNTLLRVVMKLPEKYRIPIHLFYYEDYQIKEISEVMHLPESTVKSRLKRAKEAIKKLLESEEEYVQ